PALAPDSPLTLAAPPRTCRASRSVSNVTLDPFALLPLDLSAAFLSPPDDLGGFGFSATGVGDFDSFTIVETFPPCSYAPRSTGLERLRRSASCVGACWLEPALMAGL